MMKARRKFVDGRFGQIHLRIAMPDEPAHRPLICLHMFPQSGRNFVDLIPLLARDRVVIAPDFPGYGESDGPPKRISAEDYAACIWECLDNLALDEDVDLFGIHAGAKLAVEAAFQRPDRVRRIALCSAALLTEAEIDGYWRALDKIPLDDSGSRFRQFWQMQREYAGGRVSLEAISTAYAEMMRGGEHYHWGHAAIFDYNKRFSDRVRQLDHRILLINPGDDLYEMTKRTLPLIRHARMLDRPDWKPGFLSVNANELADELRSFLSKAERVGEAV